MTNGKCENDERNEERNARSEAGLDEVEVEEVGVEVEVEVRSRSRESRLKTRKISTHVTGYVKEAKSGEARTTSFIWKLFACFSRL